MNTYDLIPQNIFNKAVKNNDLETVKKFITNEETKRCWHGDIALFQASKRGYHEMVEYLLQQEGVSQYKGDFYCIYEAMAGEHYETLEILLKDDIFYNFEERGLIMLIRELLTHTSTSPSYLKIFNMFFKHPIFKNILKTHFDYAIPKSAIIEQKINNF